MIFMRLQHADAGSLALLKQLLLQRCDRPFALILSAESTTGSVSHDVLANLIEASAWRVHKIHVAPLDDAATATLASHITRIPVSALCPYVTALRYHSNGSPAIIYGVLKSLITSGGLMFDIASGGWRIDDTLLMDALHSLSHDDTRLLVSLQALPTRVKYVLGVSAALGTSRCVDAVRCMVFSACMCCYCEHTFHE